MSIQTSLSLGDIVTRYPALARDLEDRGLDYCCGGAATLEQACRSIDLDPAVVAAALDEAIVDEHPAPWSVMGVVQLVDHIEATHHQYLWAELPRLTVLMQKVLAAHGDRHPELVDVRCCLASIRSDLEPHMRREEQMLFPAIRELATADNAPHFGFGSIGNPISVMLREHDEVGELLRTLRSSTGGYTTPDDGCASYHALYAGLEELEADTHLHVHKENNALFPSVLGLERRRAS